MVMSIVGFFVLQAVDEDLEKEAKSLSDEDGWISKQNFMKFAFSTHLCKEDPQELVKPIRF